MADTRIRKEIIDILQAAAGTVDVKLTFPTAIKATGHDHFTEVHRQSAVIGKEQGNLSHAQSLAGG